MEYFKVGTEFSSFAEIKSRIELLQNTTYAQFYIKDSRTIESDLKRRVTRRFVKPELKYVNLTFLCIAAGKFKSKSKGSRPNQKTFKQDCQAGIKLSVSKDGNTLKVISFIEDHNHECTKLGFESLPQQRRLSEAVREEAVKLFEMDCNRKQVQNHLQKITGKVIIRRDITNIKQQFMKDKTKKSNVEEVVKKLNRIQGSTTKVSVDDDYNLLGIYYQDKVMKEAFAAFPEIVFIDAVATYKLDELKMPFNLYIIVGEDGNGQSEVFATFLVSSDAKHVISKMIQTFKCHNPNWSKVKSIMTDKDFTKRHILGNEFPEANIMICLFHVFRVIQREITTKMGINLTERNICLEIIQKMVHANSEEIYEAAYEALKMTRLSCVIQYFEKNWHGSHHEWVEGFKGDDLTFLNRINNKLKTLSQLVNEVCQQQSSLHQFYCDFLFFLKSTRQVHDSNSLNNVGHTWSVGICRTGSAEEKYKALLTPYAFMYVMQQLEELPNNVIVVEEHPDGRYSIELESSHLNVSTSDCECVFRSAMQLPCRHIFAVRSIEGQDLFDEELCNPRWSIEYYKEKHALNDEIESSIYNLDNEVVEEAQQEVTIITQAEKYHKAFMVCENLSTLVSKSPSDQFKYQCDMLQRIYNAWNDGIRVGIHTINDETTGCTDIDVLEQSSIDNENSRINLPLADRKRSANLPISSPSKRTKETT
ncbi:zinc finger SWIM domain-containing protein 3-like [Antedon mediterranea]|uniref:zinc finger SWIM domain-containing protein 3-like n=1 Tax=Antedon mediterranea TaxID=105859 RepID=UPI003AF5BC35